MTAELILSLSVLALSMLGLVLFFKGTIKVQSIFNLLILILIASIFQQGLSPDDKKLVAFGIIAFLGGSHLLLGMYFKEKKWRWIFPLFTLPVLFFLGNVDLMYGDYSINFSQTSLIALFVLGFAIGLIANLITLLLKRFFENYHQSNINKTAQIVLVGLFIVPATFLASWFGILILAVGYYIYNCYAQHKNDVLFISIALLSVVTFFQSKFGMDGIDLSIGKMMASLVIGVGAVSLGTLAMKSNSKIMQFLLLLLAIICLFTCSQLNNIHPAYGGPECLIVAMIGIAIHLLVLGKREIANFLAPSIMALALIIPSNIEEETTNNGNAIATDSAVVEEVEEKGLDATHLKGSFTIDESSSQIDFKLGPKGGVTKGAIKNFKGKIEFGEDFTTSKFNVVLETKNLTTFNSMRDESVLGDAYLKAATFPVMNYSSTKLEKKDDGYLLKGEFTLLGKKNQEDVFVKYLGEKNGKHQFIGKSSLDRTKYGMASSPQEGNTIDFTFTMELK